MQQGIAPKLFVALIFEVHTSEERPAATMWIKATADEQLKTYIPLDCRSSFAPIGPLAWEAAEQVVRALKHTLAQLGVECFEHTDSDD